MSNYVHFSDRLETALVTFLNMATKALKVYVYSKTGEEL